jgi:hypothetical protein
MAMRKGKSISFDAMVKFFMQHYHIPSKRDIEKLVAKLDRIEMLVKESGATKSKKVARTSTPRTAASSGRPAKTATDAVLEIIKDSGGAGMNFTDVQSGTGFNEKKLRNIIFRLNKMGKIQRKDRGLYAPA